MADLIQQGHWDGCWKHRQHHGCALVEIAHLRGELDAAHRYNTETMYERDALRREVERLKIVASESTVDEVEDHVQALEAEIATLRGDLLDYQEQVELIAKELGNAGVMITEGPYDGVMTLINECYDLRAEIATLRKALDEAQARAAKSEVWLKWITNGKEGPSPSMFLDAYRK